MRVQGDRRDDLGTFRCVLDQMIESLRYIITGLMSDPESPCFWDERLNRRRSHAERRMAEDMDSEGTSRWYSVPTNEIFVLIRSN